jgi:hypothetical protein
MPSDVVEMLFHTWRNERHLPAQKTTNYFKPVKPFMLTG